MYYKASDIIYNYTLAHVYEYVLYCISFIHNQNHVYLPLFYREYKITTSDTTQLPPVLPTTTSLQHNLCCFFVYTYIKYTYILCIHHHFSIAPPLSLQFSVFTVIPSHSMFLPFSTYYFTLSNIRTISHTNQLQPQSHTNTHRFTKKKKKKQILYSLHSLTNTIESM